MLCVCVCVFVSWGRYLFSLQIKRDLMEGQLNCTENTAALLASHLVQCRSSAQYGQTPVILSKLVLLISE